MPIDLDDDRLTRALGTAFHDTTADLHYAGRRKPPRQPVAALPALGAVATIGAIVMVATQNGTTSPDRAPDVGGRSDPVTHSPVATPVHGRQTIKLAGFEISYKEEPRGRIGRVSMTLGPLPDRPHSLELNIFVVDDVPSGAQSIPVPGGDAQAWIGTDPTTGVQGLYVKAPTRAGGQVFVISGPGWTTDELTNLVTNGSPFN